METAKLKKFAQFARRSLIEQVSAKLKLVLAEGSAARRENTEAVKRLEKEIKKEDQIQVIERIAYIWFNRFCALRFMDVKRYTRIAVVSPADGQFQPEILAEAKMGHIDEGMVSDKIRQQIFALLDGNTPSRDPQGEAYRLLVVGACNHWHRAMPFLFQRIADYTELLMPDDLLSGNSILAYTREAMTPDVCENVEVIGWLYQFYISEKKDEVFAGLKKRKKIVPQDIPAATQLFTPHWIVRYLVENSLGRLWMLNHPGSKLVERMDYYIKPEQPETDFLRINKPEEIKICDPACGSGHMLTYAFDLLYSIYEEEGYEPAEIPPLILTHNLYGIEIDERAGELAAFALTMKARAKQRRFFRKKVQPNICVLEKIEFSESELKEYMDFVGRDLFTAPLQTTLRQFEEADNFGSLIRPAVTNVGEMLKILKSKNVSGQLFLSMTHKKALQVLHQADYLSPKYYVVIANPPYMGSKGMNGRLKSFAQDNYKNSKSDLFAMFMERNLDLARKKGAVAMITMQSWMFLSSFEKLRSTLLGEDTILSMAHLGARAFDSIGGEVVQTTAFVLENANKPEHHGGYLRLVDRNSENDKEAAIREAIKNPNCGWFFRVCAADFKKIPRSPIVYWITKGLIAAFEDGIQLNKIAAPRQGLATMDNAKFTRMWHEVSISSASIFSKHEGCKWFPYNKGGDFRKWYGNQEMLVNWVNDGNEIKQLAIRRYGSASKRVVNEDSYFLPSITWGKISSNKPSFRYQPEGSIFDVAGMSLFPTQEKFPILLTLLNSKLVLKILELLSPTLNFEAGQIGSIPVIKPTNNMTSLFEKLIVIEKLDWDSYETSWDFTNLPLLHSDYRQPTLKGTYQKLRAHWRKMTLEMQRLEEENNRIFIEAYGLKDELTSEVPLNEITLTCNPHYRYGKQVVSNQPSAFSNGKENTDGCTLTADGFIINPKLEALLLADTMKEFISYAVGCMFGRYSLDAPGLILANQGETIEDYLQRVPKPIFPADDDNVIPMLNGDWFPDDIAERFYKFLRLTFGEEHYEENLQLIEKALNIKGKRNYTIRNYFLKEFYNDHVKRYKKRPIYWLFSSPKGSFNALIYMHRYRPDTVSVVLNDYLREFRTKLVSEKNRQEAISINTGATAGEKTKAIKAIEKINKIISELEEYEREVLYPLATRQVEIDLDNGVKKNYNEFGKALKKVSGLTIK